MHEFRGVCPALITPLDKAGGVNGTAVKEIVKLIRGPDAVVRE